MTDNPNDEVSDTTADAMKIYRWYPPSLKLRWTKHNSPPNPFNPTNQGSDYFLPKSAGFSPQASVSHFKILLG